MVKSKSNKMHLEINNDLELDVNNASISRRIKKSKKTSSSPIKRIKKVSNNLKSRKRISSTNAKMLAKKKRSSKRITAKRASALKAKKPLMPSTIINGKRVPLKAAMKMSSAPKTSSASRKSASRREASGRNVSDSRRNASFSRRRASDVRRKASDARRKASASRRMSSVKRPKPAHPKNWRQGTGPAKMPSGKGKALPKNQQKSLKAKSGRSKALKQARLMSVAKEKAGKSSTVSSSPIEKVKEFWSNLTSSSDSKDKETAAAAESEDKRIEIKVRARKETVTNEESSATSSNSDSEGSSAGSSAPPASNESQTIYMPIKQSSNGKTAEEVTILRTIALLAEAIIIKKAKADNDVDVKDVKVLEKN